MGDMKMLDKPRIDEAKCQGCGLCVSVCFCNSLVIKDNVVKAINTDSCAWCALCELVCPNGAITCPFDIIVEDEEK
jgi:MinD superfamily P-loop ATPase